MRKFILITTAFYLSGLLIYTLPVTAQDLSGKMYFSNQPFATSNTSSKNNFTSADLVLQVIAPQKFPVIRLFVPEALVLPVPL